jgi:hypothetical protein
LSNASPTASALTQFALQPLFTPTAGALVPDGSLLLADANSQLDASARDDNGAFVSY